jgi:hypothetical protein
MSPALTFSDDSWRTATWPIGAFSNAPWSRAKPEVPAWPIRGAKVLIYNTGGQGLLHIRIAALEAVEGEVRSGEEFAFGRGVPFGPALNLGSGVPVGVATGTDICLLAMDRSGKSIVLGAPFAADGLLSEVLARAGVHRFLRDSPDIVRGDSRFLVVHTRDGGPRTLHLPRPALLRDAVSGKRIGSGVQIRVELEPASTAIWTWSADAVP